MTGALVGRPFVAGRGEGKVGSGPFAWACFAIGAALLLHLQIALTRAVNVLMTNPVANITANVNKYSVSATANVHCGGTKQKSNTATLSTAARIDGPRPKRSATATRPAM